MALAFEQNLLDKGSFEDFFDNCEKQSKEKIIVCFAYFVKRNKNIYQKCIEKGHLKKFESKDSSFQSTSQDSIQDQHVKKNNIQDFSHASLTAETPMLLQQVDYLIEKQNISQSIIDQQKAANNIFKKEIDSLKTNNTSLQESLKLVNNKKPDEFTTSLEDNKQVKELKKKVEVLSSQIQTQKNSNLQTSKCFQELEQELRHQNEKNSSLRETLSKKYDTILTKSREIDTLIEDSTKKSIEINNSKSKVELLTKENLNLKRQSKSDKSSENQILDFKNKLTELSKNLEELKTHNKNCEQKIVEKNMLIEKLNAELEIIKCEKNLISEVKNNQHSSSMDDKNIAILKYKALNEEQYSQNQKLTDQQSRTINELDMHMDTLKQMDILKKEVELKDFKCSSMEKVIDEIEDLYTEIKKSNDMLQQTVEVLKNENKYTQGQFEQQKKLVLDYSQKNAILERQNIESENRNCVLTLEKENLTKNFDIIKQENIKQTGKFEQNEKKHKQVEDKLFNLNKKHIQLMDLLDNSKSDYYIRYEQIQDLQEEVKYLQEKREQNKQVINLNSYLLIFVMFFLHFMSSVSMYNHKPVNRQKVNKIKTLITE